VSSDFNQRGFSLLRRFFRDGFRGVEFLHRRGQNADFDHFVSLQLLLYFRY
jgi:hypothetical protein